MIPIYNVSPSSLGTFSSCEMKWFLSYILKYKEPTGKAAAIGKCCHAILESVAQSMLLRQESRKWCKNSTYGRSYQKYDLDVLIGSGINIMIKENPHIVFTKADLDSVHDNIEIAKNHKLFPENHKKIIATESFFNEALDLSWAKYSRIDNGQVIEKPLRIVGVIDLVYIDHDDELNYVDYKFGKPYDWNQRKDKNYQNLQEDVQLCLYYWYVKNRYSPDHDIKTNIWYVQHDKHYLLYFDEENVNHAMKIVEDMFMRVNGMTRPQCTYTWQCKAFCPYSKNKFGDFSQNHLDVDTIHHDGRFDAIDDKLSMCDAMNMFFDKRNLESILENCKNVQQKHV